MLRLGLRREQVGEIQEKERLCTRVVNYDYLYFVGSWSLVEPMEFVLFTQSQI